MATQRGHAVVFSEKHAHGGRGHGTQNARAKVKTLYCAKSSMFPRKKLRRRAARYNHWYNAGVNSKLPDHCAKNSVFPRKGNLH
jgi:hypothetical protein